MKRTSAFQKYFYPTAAVLAVLLLAAGIVLLCLQAGDDAPAHDSAENSVSTTETTTAATTTTPSAGTTTAQTTTFSETTVTGTTTALTELSVPATMISTKQPAPESVRLQVPYYTQNGVLPTGCELISARMVLDYYGVTPTLNEIIENTFAEYTYMNGGRNYGYHPNDAFIGSPWDETSFGCYPPVMCNMMNRFLPEGKTAVTLEGESLSEIAETYLSQGCPVMVWATMDMKETYQAIGWYLLDEEGNETDEWYFWNANEHCLVLVGYDSEYYYFNDPLGTAEPAAYERPLVDARYADMGSRVLVVHG